MTEIQVFKDGKPVARLALGQDDLLMGLAGEDWMALEGLVVVKKDFLEALMDGLDDSDRVAQVLWSLKTVVPLDEAA